MTVPERVVEMSLHNISLLYTANTYSGMTAEWQRIVVISLMWDTWKKCKPGLQFFQVFHILNIMLICTMRRNLPKTFSALRFWINLLNLILRIFDICQNLIFLKVCEIYFKLKFSKFNQNIGTLDIFGKFLLIVFVDIPLLKSFILINTFSGTFRHYMITYILSQRLPQLFK